MKRFSSVLVAAWFFGCPSVETPPDPLSTGRGVSLGPVTRASLGVDGGTLAAGDGGVSLVVPPGALATVTELTLEPISCLAPGCVGGAWRLGPEGTTFATPATLRLVVGALKGSLESVGVAWQDAQGFWHWVDDVELDATARVVSVKTTHLSDWSHVSGVQLRPLATTVKEGASLPLQVKTCLSEVKDGLTTLLTNCDGDLAVLSPVTDWSVNGVALGDGTVGTVKVVSNSDATYTAPAKAPRPPTVAVTATLPAGLPRFSKAILFSQVTIGTPGALTGTFRLDAEVLTAPASMHLEANASLTLKDDGADETNYELGGTADLKTRTFQLGDMTCTLIDGETPKAITHQSYFKVRKTPRLAVRWSYLEQFMFHCVGPNGALDWPVSINFSTGTGQTCAELDVPIEDAAAPAGRFTATCGVNGTIDVAWSFTSSQ